ncbi:MAG: c-type cytochrome biogenesis protein CcsB [bacterium]|nr:c-type cytochrome biogenesis protein CcsB [bacterium]
MTSLDVKFFYIAFWLYLGGFLSYTLYVPFRKPAIQRVATLLMLLGLIPQTAAIFIRWATSDHVPLSNMYEYMSLMSWMAVAILLILIWRYKRPIIGSFIAPLVFMLMATASLLPKDVSQALLPALQSYWITIHVTLAALGSGAFVVACAVSFVYLMRAYDIGKSDSLPGKAMLWWSLSFIALPVAFYFILSLVGLRPFSAMTFNLGGAVISDWGSLFTSMGMGFPVAAIFFSLFYNYSLKKNNDSQYGSNLFAIMAFSLLLAGLIAGLANKNGLYVITPRSPLRIFEFFGVALVLTWPIFFLCNAVLTSFKVKFLDKLDMDLEILDEINYKAIALGYPLYTVGALFAGAIWAEQAWGSFWSWDPKEVGSLIIWLFYSGFLHARYQRQWRGSKAAILAVFGFLMVLLSFFGNYFFGGQHAYS